MSPTIYGYLINVLVTAVAAGLVFAVWVATRRRIAADTVGRAEEQAARILKDAERDAETQKRDAETQKKERLLEAKEKAHELLTQSERQAQQKRQEAQALEQSLSRRETAVAERQSSAERLDKDLQARERAAGAREKTAEALAARYERLVAQQQRDLERVASLTADEAKELLLKQIEGEARHDAANLVKRLDTEARELAADRAKQYITEAIQRSAAEHAIETTVSVVDLPSDDLKGRIIGREGRNIRALELATGIDLIVDDTPGGRIHPARIQEVVQKVRVETDEAVRKEGAAVAFELGLHDLHPEILRLMGRLKFRTSYGQNVLSHSAEVARLAGIMAREIGLDAHVAVRAAFLHDIGKAIDREMQGTHLEIGIDFLRKHGENEAVVMAMAAHHMDIDWPSLEAMIVQAADAISAARPGARRDILESYVKRLEKLEGIADSFKGVAKSFALQAGREIRIMVESEKISDEEAIWLSKDIARRIENELEYPGQIKVTVIRETRAIDYAK